MLPSAAADRALVVATCLSAAVVLVAVSVIANLYDELRSLNRELAVDMLEFGRLERDAWRMIMSASRRPTGDAVRTLLGVRRDRRQYSFDDLFCRCAYPPNSCPRR